MNAGYLQLEWLLVANFVLDAKVKNITFLNISNYAFCSKSLAINISLKIELVFCNIYLCRTFSK